MNIPIYLYSEYRHEGLLSKCQKTLNTMITINLIRLVNIILKRKQFFALNYIYYSNRFIKTLKSNFVNNKDRNFNYLGFLKLRKYILRIKYLYNLRIGFITVNNIKIKFID